MKVAVIGHVEWVEFLRVDGAVAPGAILRAPGAWAEPAGGGGVAAAELARLAGHCTLYTARGDDAVGSGLADAFDRLGVTLRAGVRPEPHRRATTLIDPAGERTIVVIGPAQEPRGDELPGFEAVDAVYFCKGDAAAVRAARAARVLVGTARVLPELAEAGVRLDALVHSATDPSECYAPGDLPVPPALVATTEGSRGGRWATADGRSGRWEASPAPAPVRDTYGAGDCFAAALTWALARGLPPDRAVALAAERGAAALGRAGAHGRLPSAAR